MTETPQPTSGSLHAVVIRACQAHGPNCKKHRKIEDLGEVASFGSRPQPTLPNPHVGLTTGRPAEPTIFDQLGQWLERITHKGGPHRG